MSKPKLRLILASWNAEKKAIVLNSDLWSNPEKLQHILDLLELNEEVPKGCASPEFIITHEMGHGIYPKLPTKTKSRISDVIMKAAENGELRAFCKNSTTNNIEEAFCDIFGAIYHQPIQDQPDFVRKIAQIYLEGDV